MRIVSELWQRLLRLFFRSQEEREMDEELRFHIDKETEKNLAAGMSGREARRQAHVRLGGVERVKESTREAWGIRPLQILLTDVRIAGRALRRTPGQAAAAVITLGLGIGLTTTMVGVLYGAFFRAIPVENPERLVQVQRLDFRAVELRVPFHDFVEWREAQRSFTDLAAGYNGTVGLRGSEEAMQFNAAFVSWNALRILGAQPALGRNFLEEDDKSGAPLVAIVSNRAWQERLGGEAGIIGREAIINGEPATIIGVMPDGFHFPRSQDVWVPLRLDANLLEWGQGPSLDVFGHLRDGVTLDVATAEMDALAQRIASDHPETNEGIGARVRPYLDLADFGPTLLINWMLMASALGVLLIACVNVANLLLARAAVRVREMALRTAMGAHRLQIMSLMLAESSILTLVGAFAGVGVGWLGLRGIRYAMIDTNMPYWMEFKLDLTVLVFTAGAAMLAGIVAGMIPAVKATGGNLASFLKDGSRGATGLKIGRLSRSLVWIEVAFSTCLLIMAGLMTKSVASLDNFELPFADEGVFSAGIDLFDATNPDEGTRGSLFHEVLDRLVEMPGVQSAALASRLPGLEIRQRPFAIEGREYVSEQEYPLAHSMDVSAGFFDFLGVAPVRGRVFGSLDRAGEHPVAIVNQSFARKHFGGQNPIGLQLKVAETGSASPLRTIVGVVPDLRMQGKENFEASDGSGVYLPITQTDHGSANLLIRSQGAPLDLTDGVRELVRSVDPNLAIFGVNTLSEQIRRGNWGVRIVGSIYIVFGGAALFLASVGLFAVVSFSTERRTQEVGIRMAVGAKGRDVVRLILSQGLRHMSLGLIAGVVMALGIARVLVFTLFETQPWDPAVYTMTVGVILFIGALATLVPAMRAARLDPVRALQAK